MAIPEKPESRAEMYLNKIASGSGTIPAKPESRLEQYLDAIANNGGGGGSGGGSGGGGGVLVCREDENNTLDHTWQEIHDANFAVLQLGFDTTNYDINLILGIGYNPFKQNYFLYTYSIEPSSDVGVYVPNRYVYIAQSANDYPVYYEGE